jgi:methylenetetrahydrofolate dehydrogenase (NADP+)/methenyltetrahydrofolate cyclohydrolase
MKVLNGSDIAGYVKERQAKSVRSTRKKPTLRIIRDSDDPVITKYVGLKKQYGEDIGVVVEDMLVDDVAEAVALANEQEDVDGMIVQLPLKNMDVVEDILGKIAPEKDVDGLSGAGEFDSATATAILWLLSGYGVEFGGKKVAVVGRGRLVGGPLIKMFGESGVDFEVFGRGTDLAEELPRFDVIITATGQAGIIRPEMIKPGAVVVDAGTASEGGVIVGDVAEEVRERDDISVTPKIGGVGPLTVAVLFENAIRAALKNR